jgi:hypothetical protein
MIGGHNVGTLEDISELHIHDFGIFLELEPDEEEKQMLENNIQMALTQQLIDLSDAIDLRTIKNVKLANQLLKIRRKKKLENDQKLNQQNIQAQAQANAQAQQQAAQAEVQKNQALKASEAEMEQLKAEIASARLEQEMQLKKQLMDHEFQLNMQLEQMKNDGVTNKEKYKEDRKDERTKIQASQQSELIDQRNSGKPPKKFESSGNDILGGGFDMGAFEPK